MQKEAAEAADALTWVGVRNRIVGNGRGRFQERIKKRAAGLPGTDFKMMRFIEPSLC